MIKILYMSAGRPLLTADSPLGRALGEFGAFRIIERGKDLSDTEVMEHMRKADVLLTHWAGRRIPGTLAEDPGRLSYIINLGGTCKATVPIEIIRAGIPVTNWGDTPARPVAEGAMSLLLAVLKDLRGRTEALTQGKSFGAKRLNLPSGSLYETRVGLYGCGVIGSRFVEMLRPFEPEIHVFDPYASSLPSGCHRAASLNDLCDTVEVLVIWAGLSEETNASIDANRLARLPDHGIVINAARGEIIEQDALFAELQSGRLRAGLDVLVNDNYLPQGHPAHTWPNLLITCHDINSAHWPVRPPHLSYGDKIVLDNLRRFIAGEPLRFVMDEARYLRSS